MRGLRPGQRNNFDAVTQQVYTQAIDSFTLVARVLMIVLSLVGLLVGGIGVVAIDRKSTRLNSSHPSISYAVFCLKKKNKTHDIWSHSPALSPIELRSPRTSASVHGTGRVQACQLLRPASRSALLVGLARRRSAVA